MKRTLLSALFIFTIITTAQAQYAEFYLSRTDLRISSLRLAGINPMLLGVISDEYTDYMAINTANILDVDGYRVYPQVSDLGMDGNEMMLGGLAPLGFGKAGAFAAYNRNRGNRLIFHTTFYEYGNPGSIEPAIRAAGTEMIKTYNMLTADNIKRGEYHYADSDKSSDMYESERGDSTYSGDTVSLDALAGLDVLDFADFGIKISYYKETDTVDNEYLYNIRSTEDTDDYRKESTLYEESNRESILSIAPSIRNIEQLGIDLGATLNISLYDISVEKSNDTSFGFGQNFSDFPFPEFTDDYSREYTLQEDIDMTGTEFHLKLDGAYPLSDTLNIKGVAAAGTIRKSGDIKRAESDSITADGGLDIITEDFLSETKGDKESKTNSFAFLLGLEKHLSESLLIGAGLGLGHTLNEEEKDEARAKIVEDGEEKFGDTETEEINSYVNSVITLPLGIEWKASDWISARFGASYSMSHTEEKNRLYETRFEDDTESAEISGRKRISDNSGVYENIYVDYFAGFGFNFTENITVDTTVQTLGNRLNLSRVDMSATLKF